MVDRYIWVKKRRYYYFDTYRTWKNAYNVGRYYKRCESSNWFILPVEEGMFGPKKRYRLYLDKVMRFGLF